MHGDRAQTVVENDHPAATRFDWHTLQKILEHSEAPWYRKNEPRPKRVLPYSGATFIQAFPRECSETFLVGHRLTFEFFAGVPTCIRYDISVIAAIEDLRKLMKLFLRLQSQYLRQAWVIQQPSYGIPLER